MAQPTTIDVLAPFDPTAYSTISGAQLYQLAGGIVPNVDQGLVVYSEDVGGVVNAPRADVTTKWQRYVWHRQAATRAYLYIWDTTMSPDPVLFNWRLISEAVPAAGSIIGNMIADGTITSDKISSVDAATIFPPLSSGASGPASGIKSNNRNPLLRSLCSISYVPCVCVAREHHVSY